MHERRRVWQCKRCGAQTSVTAGTVMHNTQTPSRLRFWAAYLVATHHPGISAVQLQRQLGIARHERAWMMLHKLRRAMVAPEREPLKREVEVDEFFLGSREKGLHGRARGKKVMCGVAIEVRGRGSGRLRLAILENASQRSLGEFVSATTAPGAVVVHTDAWAGYRGLPELGYEHSPLSQNAGEAGEEPYLPRAHRAISNLKAWLHGSHRHARHERTCSPTSTSSSFATTDAATPTPPSRRCSASAPATSQRPTGRSSTRPQSPAETIGYATSSRKSAGDRGGLFAQTDAFARLIS